MSYTVCPLEEYCIARRTLDNSDNDDNDSSNDNTGNNNIVIV